jgi:hypothetical protein
LPCVLIRKQRGEDARCVERKHEGADANHGNLEDCPELDPLRQLLYSQAESLRVGTAGHRVTSLVFGVGAGQKAPRS